MKKNAFTLIEVLLAMFIGALVFSIGFFASYGSSFLSDITSSQTDLIVSALRKAQMKSLAGSLGAPYSVKFSTNSIALMPINEVTTLESVKISSVQLQGGGDTVTFSTALGEANPSGKINIVSNSGDTRTIIIYPSGTVDSQMP